MTSTYDKERYTYITREYQKKFGELPTMLFRTGPAVALCLDLMEQAVQGKRGKVSESDLGYPPGSDVSV
jgi:hypothetical protein